MITNLAKTVAARMGYEVHRYQSHREPFMEMRRLSMDTASPIIFDVGAHYGEVSLQFRRFLPTSQIYAFEPFPTSYGVLREKTGTDPRIQACKLGLCDVTGVQRFYSNVSSATNSLLEIDDDATEIWGSAGAGLMTTTSVDLEFKTIDDFVEERNLPGIDILKLDCQGAEFRVLKGAERTIAEHRIKLLYTEIITAPTYRGQKTFDEMLSILRGYGFTLHNLYNLALVDGRLCQVDALFCAPEAARGPRGDE